MSESILAPFAAPAATRERKVFYQGKEFVLRGTPAGDAYFEVIYPDPQKRVAQSQHWAVNNGRTRVEGDKTYSIPYPEHLFSAVLAIERTLVGLGPDQRGSIYALYDSEHIELFFALRQAAYEVLGLASIVDSNAGLGAWQVVFTHIRQAFIALREDRPGMLNETLLEAQGAAGRALEELGVKPEYIHDDLEPGDKDPVMEGMTDDPTLAHSPA